MIITSSSKNKQLLGENNKSLNKRVLSSVDLHNSNLVIDFYYYSSLIGNKLKYNSSFGRKWAALASGGDKLTALQAIDAIFEPIVNIKRLITIKNIILLHKPVVGMSSIELELFKVFKSISTCTISTENDLLVSTLYSLAVEDKQKYLILSDNLEFWLICSRKSDIHYCTITKNNRPKIYTEKFGLECLSSLIGTNKLVNKLRLGKIKYVNLQYLFLLLLYTKFKNTKAIETFDMSGKDWLGSKGKALKMLSESHKEISYYFLTKPDMIDIFLSSSTTHFVLNLSRLLKITPFDIKLMSAFSTYYQNTAVKTITITKMTTSPVYPLVNMCKLLSDKLVTVKPTQTNKKSLPEKVHQPDISNLETSMAVDAILRGLSW